MVYHIAHLYWKIDITKDRKTKALIVNGASLPSWKGTHV